MTRLRRATLQLAFSLLASAATAHAERAVHAQKFDPNALAKKTVTVSSEITRGSSAVFAATLEVRAADADAKYHAANKVIAQNQQQNTDTDGFLLGAHFRAWTGMSTLTKLDSQVVDTARAQELGRIYFTEYRKLQRHLGIDDATLCKLAGIRHEAIKSEIDKWSKATLDPRGPKGK